MECMWKSYFVFLGNQIVCSLEPYIPYQKLKAWYKLCISEISDYVDDSREDLLVMQIQGSTAVGKKYI